MRGVRRGSMRWRIAIRVLLACFLISVTGAVVLSTRSPVGVGNELEFSFQAYSNSPSGKRYALFSVTNIDTCVIQLANSGTVEFAGPNIVSNAWRSYDVHLYPDPLRLRRGQRCIVVAEAPTNREPWRLTVGGIRRSLKQQLVEITGRFPLIPDYNNGTPDLVYVTSNWAPQ